MISEGISFIEQVSVAAKSVKDELDSITMSCSFFLFLLHELNVCSIDLFSIYKVVSQATPPNL